MRRTGDGEDISPHQHRWNPQPEDGPGAGSLLEEEVFQDKYAYEHSPDKTGEGGIPIPKHDDGDYDREYYERL